MTSAEKSPPNSAVSLDPLWAISAVDGRYANKLRPLSPVVSEGALNCYRIRVEAAWLLHLSDSGGAAVGLTLTDGVRKRLVELSRLGVTDFGGLVPEATAAANRVKEYEKTTNHDVKAVEYFVRDELRAVGASERVLAFVHFACTSEDINNVSYALMQRDLRDKIFLPAMQRIDRDLCAKIKEYAGLAMLSRTHGQSATPSTLGKELAVFAHLLRKIQVVVATLEIDTKFNGAVGNFNAHMAAIPEINWTELTRSFLEDRLGFLQNVLTTQIENHDSLITWCQAVQRYNTVLVGLMRDMWSYISIGYFKQRIVAGEVGSSTMPHKVNPIDFENAEGNLGIAISMAQHFAEKLPISRWQRDLSDSTVLRSLGTFAGHTLLAWESALKGLGKVTADPERIGADINQAWEVLAEPIQTVMRAYGVSDAYERLKAATRGTSVRKEDLHQLIAATKEIPEDARDRLLKMRPEDYTGYAKDLALNFLKSAAPK